VCKRTAALAGTAVRTRLHNSCFYRLSVYSGVCSDWRLWWCRLRGRRRLISLSVFVNGRVPVGRQKRLNGERYGRSVAVCGSVVARFAWGGARRGPVAGGERQLREQTDDVKKVDRCRRRRSRHSGRRASKPARWTTRRLHGRLRTSSACRVESSWVPMSSSWPMSTSYRSTLTPNGCVCVVYRVNLEMFQHEMLSEMRDYFCAKFLPICLQDTCAKACCFVLYLLDIR